MLLCIGLLVILLAIFSLAGWGRLCEQIAGVQACDLPLATVTGLAAVIFIGGLLNLFHVALGRPA